eukprot:772427-Rhodomonas_salina.2
MSRTPPPQSGPSNLHSQCQLTWRSADAVARVRRRVDCARSRGRGQHRDPAITRPDCATEPALGIEGQERDKPKHDAGRPQTLCGFAAAEAPPCCLAVAVECVAVFASYFGAHALEWPAPDYERPADSDQRG